MTSKILLVEDDPAGIKLATLILRQAGYLVLHAFDGLEAVHTAREEMPDLVLMDVHMPGMDGLTATGILKRDPATAHIPVLAFTAHAMQGDREKIMAAGCDGYIAKPFGLKDFTDSIARALRLNPRRG